MSDPNRPITQNLLRYHLNPKKFKENPHAYPFLWKRITFKECVRTSYWGVLGAFVWYYFSAVRHNNIHDFYREYCKSMGLPENLFAGKKFLALV
jgi:hypothetical protein